MVLITLLLTITVMTAVFIQDLAAGGCMGNFRWDGGPKRKFLDESLPTDSAVNNISFKLEYTKLMSISRLSCTVWLRILIVNCPPLLTGQIGALLLDTT